MGNHGWGTKPDALDFGGYYDRLVAVGGRNHLRWLFCDLCANAKSKANSSLTI